MNILYLINFVLIGAVSLVTASIMIYWHRASRGNWRRHDSGRALMKLLAIIFFITANAAVQWSLTWLPLEVRAWFYFGLYIVFILALLGVGRTIRSEVRRGQRSTEPLHKEAAGDVVHIARIAQEESHE